MRRCYVAASMAVAIAASGLALWLAAGRGGRPPLILSAVAFGIAVSGMHYTAMEGVTLFPHATAASTAPALSTDLLAIVVAVVAFCVSGDLPAVPGAGSRASCRLPAESGGHRPVRGAGHPLRPNRVDRIPTSAAAATRRSAAPAGRRGASRAICRSSATARTQFVAVDDVVAVHANAHYTYHLQRAATSCSARSRSATSSSGSTTTASSASTAATSSISSA